MELGYSFLNDFYKQDALTEQKEKTKYMCTHGRYKDATMPPNYNMPATKNYITTQKPTNWHMAPTKTPE